MPQRHSESAPLPAVLLPPVLYSIPAIVMLGNALDGRVPASVYSLLRIDPYETKAIDVTAEVTAGSCAF